MEPNPPSSTATASPKLRLMCSHGGHIVPRPTTTTASYSPNHHNTKSFFYVGGDNRIVSVDRHTVTTIDSFVSHLAAALSIAFSFTLKYQLPHVDLTSLISLTSNEDFHVFIDEYDRLCSSHAPSRIRVFLFRMDPGLGGPVIRHPKTEAWFFDALRNARIVGECSNGFLCSGQESMVLETSSSFGSTSSSSSLTNLAWKCQSYEDGNEFVVQDGMAKLMQNNSVPSENSVSNIMPHQHQNITYQDPVIVQAPSMQAKTANYSSGTIITSESANSTNMLEMGSNQNQLAVQTHQHFHQFAPLQHMTSHQPNHPPHPTYLVPNYAQIIPYNGALHTTTASNHSYFMASQNYYHRAASSSATTSSYNGNKQQVGIDVSSIMYVQSQNVALTNNNTESLDEHCGGTGGVSGHDLIYKSQPPPPSA